MISIDLKEDKKPIEFDYSISSIESLDEFVKVAYKPIFGVYKIALYLKSLKEIKYVLSNKSKYSHLDIHLLLDNNIYTKLSLAVPDLVNEGKKSMWEFLKDGVSDRRLLIDKKVLSLLYSSVGKSYDEITETLDILEKQFGPFMLISDKDLSEYIVINNIVYPRTVLISYINLYRWRKQKLTKCLEDISPDIVLASMIKQVKKLHEEKNKYLTTGLGSKFIQNLNTRNLNLMYYTLVVNKPYTLNDIVLLLEIYERGLEIK